MDVCSSSATSLLHKLIVLSESLSPIATSVSSWIMLSRILVFHTAPNTQSRVVELRGMDSHAYARRPYANNVEVCEDEDPICYKTCVNQLWRRPIRFHLYLSSWSQTQQSNIK